MRLTLSIPSFGPFYGQGRLTGRDARKLKVRGSLELRLGANGRPDLAATLAGAHELAAAGATDMQLGLLAFVRRPEQQEPFFAELRDRWAAVSGARSER